MINLLKFIVKSNSSIYKIITLICTNLFFIYFKNINLIQKNYFFLIDLKKNLNSNLLAQITNIKI